MIGDFAETCKSDIEGSNCGRISQLVHSDADDIFVQHSQVLLFDKIKGVAELFSKKLSFFKDIHWLMI